MTSNSIAPQTALPSSAQLIKSSLLALVTAAIVLVIAILPAEYGIDPTGIGGKLGLSALHQTQEPEPSRSSASPSSTLSTNLLGNTLSPVSRQSGAYRNDTMRLELAPGQGAEIKARMRRSETFLFHWSSAGQPVYFDMHGERLNDGDNFTSFWIGRDQSQASGTFTAPFDGTHGWYWKNSGPHSITIELTISGYYADLYRP